MFKNFKALVENQIDNKIKCLKTDNGGEFCSIEFDHVLANNGIKRIKIVPFTPQENDTVKRLNRKILERACSMLSNVGLGKQFWSKVVNTTVYLINRGPSSQLDFEILKEK